MVHSYLFIIPCLTQLLALHSAKSTKIQGSNCECLCPAWHHKISGTPGHSHLVFQGPTIMALRKATSKQAKSSVPSLPLGMQPLVRTTSGQQQRPTEKASY